METWLQLFRSLESWLVAADSIYSGKVHDTWISWYQQECDAFYDTFYSILVSGSNYTCGSINYFPVEEYRADDADSTNAIPRKWNIVNLLRSKEDDPIVDTLFLKKSLIMQRIPNLTQCSWFNEPSRNEFKLFQL